MAKEAIECPMCDGKSKFDILYWCPVCRREGTIEVDTEPRPEQTQTEGPTMPVAEIPPYGDMPEGVVIQQELRVIGCNRTIRVSVEKSGRSTLQIENTEGPLKAIAVEMGYPMWVILSQMATDAARITRKKN